VPLFFPLIKGLLYTYVLLTLGTARPLCYLCPYFRSSNKPSVAGQWAESTTPLQSISCLKDIETNNILFAGITPIWQVRRTPRPTRLSSSWQAPPQPNSSQTLVSAPLRLSRYPHPTHPTHTQSPCLRKTGEVPKCYAALVDSSLTRTGYTGLP
jgi:hypothetical protein